MTDNIQLKDTQYPQQLQNCELHFRDNNNNNKNHLLLPTMLHERSQQHASLNSIPSHYASH